ncbi:MAG: NADH-quinone oxidoreductase subunit L [Deltaproteobacteria bacterium]|nr:NADH-quinone oxidoreductase subunit L [Deltaproteobacteria bacterium]
MEPKLFAAIPVIILLPAIGGKRWGDRFAAVVTNAAVFSSFGVSLYAWWYLRNDVEGMVYLYKLYPFLKTDLLNIGLDFRFDRLSAVMCLVVTGVSSLIHLYSTGYMKGDRSYARFFSHLNMFVFFMLLLVLGANLVVMFAGWEGVGLSSYLLIGFWYEDMEKAVAGKKAFVVNRIGDFGFLLGMLMLLMYNHGSVDFFALERFANSGMPPVANELNMTVICLLLFLGAVGKSAQIPLYVWLPDAMAGPTPVSALIHAATMVTAGVYMVARLSFLFVHAPIAMAVVAGVGATTALFAATIGLAQTDIKKVLAYSTVSLFGYMFLAVGAGAFASGMFHLTTHAFFKACLFLGAGSVIHALHHQQDIRRMGGLARKMPVTHITFLISTLAIAGIPPLSGFFSKDEILTSAFLASTPFPTAFKVFWAFGAAGAFLTAFYMMRLYWLTFRGTPRDAHAHEHAHESPWSMGTALVLLAAAATVAGVLGLPGEGHLFSKWLAPVVGKYTLEPHHASHLLHWALIGLSVAIGAAGLIAGWLIYRSGPDGVAARIAASTGPMYRLVAGKYFIDELYGLIVVRPLKAVAAFSYKVVDKIFIDLLGVNVPAWAVKGIGVLPRMFHDGNLRTYMLAVVVGVLCLWVVL